MKIFKNSKNIKRIMIVLVFLLLFNFTMPIYANAAEDWTGKLIEPLADLVCSVGDSFMNLMQGIMMPGSPVAIQKRTGLTDTLMKKGVKNKWMYALADGAAFMATISPVMNMAKDFAAIFGQEDLMQDYRKWYQKMPRPLIFYSPAAIFANKVPAFDVNFINPSGNNKYEYLLMKNEDGSLLSEEEYKDYMFAAGLGEKDIENSLQLRKKVINGETPGNTAAALAGVISRWYIALRNISIVGLMIVLLYIGIRIIISSTSEENAKYKTMIQDWVVAMVLVFFIHFIMLGLLTLTESFINMLDGDTVFRGGTDILMQDIRIKQASARVEDQETKSWLTTFGYAVMYTTLVIYTIMFTVQYLKRTIYMAFLTIISPMVALTYPIDKLRDGKAQAFNMWLKEYMFNLLLQPIHLLLYIIFISSAIEFASQNILYAIVAIGFLLQAEKFIKKMFGVQAEGGAFGGGFASGAMFSSALGLLQKGTSKITGALAGGSNNGAKGTDGGNGGNSKFRQQEKINDPAYNTDLGAFNSNNKKEVTGRDTLNTGIGGGNATTSIGNGTDSAPGKINQLSAINRLKNLQNNNVPGNFKNMKTIQKRKLAAPKSTNTKGVSRIGTNFADMKNMKTLKKPNINKNTKMTGKKSSKLMKPVKKVGSGLANVGRRYVNKGNGVRVAKFAARTGLKATLGAVGGTIGLAAGLASDDYANVFKYGALGLGGGAILGGEISKQGEHVIDRAAEFGTNAKEDYLRGIYDNDEYQEKVVNPRIERQFMKDKEEQEYYRQEYGGKVYKDKMKEALEFQKYGITDQEQIRQAIKVRDKSALPIQEVATASKYVNNIKKEDLTNEQGIEKIRKSISHKIHKEEDQNRFLKTMGQLEGIDDGFMPISTSEKPTKRPRMK